METVSFNITSPNDGTSREAIAAALLAGNRVVVLVKPPRGERRLAFKAFPYKTGFKLVGLGGNTTMETPHVERIVERGFINVGAALRIDDTVTSGAR